MGQRRVRLEIEGAVQGVGFRPFVFRLATELGLVGHVANDVRGVTIEVEGEPGNVDRFCERLEVELPAPARIEQRRIVPIAPVGDAAFVIGSSTAKGAKAAQLLPDLATCDACLAEIADPADRRHRYPFTNCTHCGPRLSIILSLPYDRPRTTMRGFTLCDACRAEYDHPTDRRFHAQPNACPSCGPQLELWDRAGERLARGPGALEEAAVALTEGRIVAVQGLGGFHMMLDARDGAAVSHLRSGKPRRDKPLALMVRDLSSARALCELDETAEALLLSPESPIVLLPRHADAAVDAGVAPCNPHLGLMLPYTPLHHLLLREVDFPVVATSGNLSEEPICTDPREALERLGAIADRFLVHDRPIARHVDDSVVTVVDGAPQILRRARGYAPRPILLRDEVPPLLAVGGHLKNTVALAVGRRVFVSQHVGDMETPQALEAFERVVRDFLELYGARPVGVAHDLHPDYPSTRWARAAVDDDGPLGGLPLIGVQHHHAHLAACLAETGTEGPALGVIWDGTGYGPDGTVWGGEFLSGDATSYRRVGHLRPLRLPGGEAAVREPRRSAIALLWEVLGPQALERDDLAPVRAFRLSERRVIARMLERGIHAPFCSSAGRLFDAVAALAGFHPTTSFEGQAAMALEHVVADGETSAYTMTVDHGLVDWTPLVHELLEDLARAVSPGVVAARFHNALTVAVREVVLEQTERRVVLSGGCFQNRRLTRSVRRALEAEGVEVLTHRRVPPNDGGIALGQIAVAAAGITHRRRGSG